MPLCEAKGCQSPAQEQWVVDGRTGWLCDQCKHMAQIEYLEFPGWADEPEPEPAPVPVPEADAPKREHKAAKNPPPVLPPLPEEITVPARTPPEEAASDALQEDAEPEAVEPAQVAAPAEDNPVAEG